MYTERKESKKAAENRSRRSSAPSFVYIETVRGKDREKLHAESCVCCEKYYEETGRERMEKVSRHRCTFSRPPSPPGFWDIGPF